MGNPKTRYDWIPAEAAEMRRLAMQGTFDGRMPSVRMPYFQSCRRQWMFRGLSAVFTRDTGYHTSGWWKNPDYERCFHLTLSFFDPTTQEPAPRDQETTDRFLEALFGADQKLLWCEPPYTAEGKIKDIWHYRLFCDEGWQAIKPRGEVYSRELTEAGWKSFSDVQEELRIAREAAAERANN